jgi:hypothetical protein
MAMGSGAWQVPDNSFEFRLERMFAEAPALPDAELFRLRVTEKLDRGWTARRLLIGVMGAVGGVIGAVQLVGSGGLGALAAISVQSQLFMRQLSAQLASAGSPVDAQVVLTAAALAIIAAGFGVARLVRDI